MKKAIPSPLVFAPLCAAVLLLVAACASHRGATVQTASRSLDSAAWMAVDSLRTSVASVDSVAQSATFASEAAASFGSGEQQTERIEETIVETTDSLGRRTVTTNRLSFRTINRTDWGASAERLAAGSQTVTTASVVSDSLRQSVSSGRSVSEASADSLAKVSERDAAGGGSFFARVGKLVFFLAAVLGVLYAVFKFKK